MADTMTAPTLHLCAGYSGYRLAYIDGDRFEVVGEFPTFEAAAAAKKAADAASLKLRAPEASEQRLPPPYTKEA